MNNDVNVFHVIVINYSQKHIILDCVDVVDVSQTFYNINNLSGLFKNVAGNTIFFRYLNKNNIMYQNIDR